MATSTNNSDPSGSGKTTTKNSGWGYLGNGAIFAPPEYGNTPWFPYASLKDQMTDAQNAWAKGAGAFAGNNVPMYNGIAGSDPNKTFGGGFANQKANVGGGLLGMTAYSGGPNPFLAGFNPFTGRGNAYPGGAGPGGPGGAPGGPAGPGDGSPGQGSGPPPAPGMPAPRDPRSMPPGMGQPTQPALPPGGGGLLSPHQPGTPTQPSLTGATGGHFPNAYAPNPGGLLNPKIAPNQPGATGAPQGQPMTYPQANYKVSEINGDGGRADANTTPEAMAAYFMSLPEDQRGDYFNAISQYGLTKGQNLGGALDQALRSSMGSDAFRQWLTHMDGQQGSTIKAAAGLPSWLISGLS